MDPSVGDAVTHLSREWRAFLDAPVIFITGGAAIAGAMWALMKWAFGARLTSKDERIAARDEKITSLELEVDRFKRKADWLGSEVARLTPLPLPLRFVLEDITRMKRLDDFVEGVRDRTDEIATRAATFGEGFRGCGRPCGRARRLPRRGHLNSLTEWRSLSRLIWTRWLGNSRSTRAETCIVLRASLFATW
jgi:hypothetical protein